MFAIRAEYNNPSRIPVSGHVVATRCVRCDCRLSTDYTSARGSPESYQPNDVNATSRAANYGVDRYFSNRLCMEPAHSQQ